MPRKARKKSFTNIYHVVIKGIDRQLIFEEYNDYKKYIEILELYKKECHFKLYAYCLMSNHVHLLIHTFDTSLSTIFSKINTHYAVWFNMKYQRTGHLQDGRFFSEPIEDVYYLLNVIKYIHFNPEKAGLENSPGTSYPWSSIFEYFNHTNNLVDTKHIYSIFDSEILLDYSSVSKNSDILDVDTKNRRIPDDVAKEIIIQECNCFNITDFLSLPLKARNDYLCKLHTLGVSIRQLNRLTGVSKGVIQRVVTKGHSS